MIFDFSYMQISDEDWKYIILQYLNEWTEIPFTSSEGYDIDEVRFFDGLLGYLLKWAEKIKTQNPEQAVLEFINSWQYQGKLYRVMHTCNFSTNGGEDFRLPEVNYHRMITHWTTDPTFGGLRHKLLTHEKYVILEADTGNHIALDVNKFRQANNCGTAFTEKENEIIFPLYQEITKEYRMTIDEFVKLKRESNAKEEQGFSHFA